MYGIDTNVLLRYLLQDDEIQNPIATHFLETICSEETPAFVNNTVLVECVWVLQRGYEYKREDIVKFLRHILGTKEVQVENQHNLIVALGNYQRGSADFADYLIAQTNKRYGCSHTATFDKKAANNPNFQLLT